MATHSSIFAWEIPWREEPSGLQFMGKKKKEKKKKRENESPIALPWWGLNFLLPQIYQRCFICALHSHSSFIIYVGD